MLLGVRFGGACVSPPLWFVFESRRTKTPLALLDRAVIQLQHMRPSNQLLVGRPGV